MVRPAWLHKIETDVFPETPVTVNSLTRHELTFRIQEFALEDGTMKLGRVGPHSLSFDVGFPMLGRTSLKTR